jgi:MFS family permease
MFSDSYKRYVLGSLTLVCTFNYLDRSLISLLLQPIKVDLHLSDTQLGVLTGIAFGLFYATLGLPIARLADRGNRVTITAIAIGLWGLTVMACLLVVNFAQLVLARIAAGVGESGCMPPTYSLLGDYFPAPAERTRAMAVYWLASPISTLISFIVGGLVNERYGWRVTFFVMGIPALLICLLIKVTIVEPRVSQGAAHTRARESASIIRVMGVLWHQRSSRHLIFAIVLLWTMGLGLGPWYAAFLMRTYDMSTSELGVWLGLIFGLSGSAGIWLGGYVVGRWLPDNDGLQVRVNAVLVALLVPCFALFLLLPEKRQALIALVPLMMVFSFFLGPVFALMQRLVEEEMRATTLAVVMLFANLIGMGVGPLLVGMLSDLFVPVLGRDSLRYAMLIMSFVSLWSSYHLWQVGRTVEADLSAVAERRCVTQKYQAATEALLEPDSST